MISIGVVAGGPETVDEPLMHVVMNAMRVAESLCDDEDGVTPSTNVVYHFPGSIAAPDWSGIRDGRFSRKRLLIMIQVAIPRDALASSTPNDYVVKSLSDAIVLAGDCFESRGFNYPSEDARRLIENIASRLVTSDSGRSE